MCNIYLNPSSDPFKRLEGGGNEGYYMNLITDYMIPFLRSSGIGFQRSNPSDLLIENINKANQGEYDLYLSLNSAKRLSSIPEKTQGINIHYSPGSERGKQIANLMAKELSDIYPHKDKIDLIPTEELLELSKTNHPAVYLEIAYRDDDKDSIWLRNNLSKIAQAMVKAIAEFLNISFNLPQSRKKGLVTTQSGPLNIRFSPNIESEILSQIPKGEEIDVLEEFDGWYVVMYNGIEGYSKNEYITLL